LTERFRPFHAKILLVVLHLVGVLGILGFFEGFVDANTFVRLSPFNLLLTASLLFVFVAVRTRLFVFFLACLLIGFLAELIGVQTGLPFGEYTYGESLGPKWWGVPLVIGVNWFLVAVGSQALLRLRTNDIWIRTIGAALVMVGFDLLVEPVAIQIDFWHWSGGEIPLQNYAGWLLVGLIIQAVFAVVFKKEEANHRLNPMALPVLAVQLLFFAALNLML
jgi:putative membrane protein